MYANTSTGTYLREELWVEIALANSWRAFVYNVKLDRWYYAKCPKGYPYSRDWKPHPFDYPQPLKYAPLKLCEIRAPKDNAGEYLRYAYNRNDGERVYPFHKRTFCGYDWPLLTGEML
ncbi:hypothetical protein EAG_01381 [Camponotus floridanus]|uniref:Uncharacterized protein n=1 Tax=Camponotus floridanus TaxID=104421 RepID=E2APW6_CAMFO|nr:hypothetical protein EAG_01381 [Camponotus floridanus]